MSCPSPPLFDLPYRPLEDNKQEIRVLRFLNISSTNLTEEKIQCSIEHVSLKDPPVFSSQFKWPDKQESPIVWDIFTECIDFRDSNLERTAVIKAASIAGAQSIHHSRDFRYTWGDFEALSYTWGDQADTKEISVNGININVPRNLEEALKALRDLEETRLGMCYWVDSLCIDQSNEDEKNKQVKRMRDIYTRARAVIVWLGQEEAMDRLAVETMYYRCHNANLKDALDLPEELLLEGGPALLAFVKKTYWTRSWIIQELAMNHNSTLILCGKFKLTRRMIRLGAIYCQRLLQGCEDLSYRFGHELDTSAWPIASRVYRLMNLTFIPHGGVSIDRLLNLVRRADATIKKDKIYSIIGLLDPDIARDVKPDYSLSEQQVYTEFIISVVEKSRKLQQIIFGGIPTSEGWPSWVPDWRKPFGRHHVQYLRSSQASGQLPSKFQFMKTGKNRHLLACVGFQVDKVDGIATESSTSWHSNQSSTASNRYGNQISEALQTTLVMNHPGATGELLLQIPWVSKCDTNARPAKFLRQSKWSKLFQSSYYEKFNAFTEHNENFLIGGQRLRSFFPQSARKDLNVSLTLRCMRLALLCLEQRALITTKTGYLGLAPLDVCSGDIVAILLGISCPVVLRPCSNNLYQIVGECYIHGFMDGEILRQESEQKVVQREFILC